MKIADQWIAAMNAEGKTKCACGRAVTNLPGTRWHPTSICEKCFYALSLQERKALANGCRRKVIAE